MRVVYRCSTLELNRMQVKDILTLLGGFESTVFETRAMPRMPLVRQLDMDITEISNTCHVPYESDSSQSADLKVRHASPYEWVVAHNK